MPFDWKAVLRKAAPSLATAITSGPAAIAVAASKALASAILGKEDASEDELAAKLESLTAADYIALDKANKDWALEMARLAQQDNSLEASDRANARAREIATHDGVTPTLAIGVTVILALALAGLYFVAIPASNRDVLIQSLGNVITAWGVIMAYYFGTSFGSRAKDRTIGRALNDRP